MLDVVIEKIEPLAEGVKAFTLTPLNDEPVPPFGPGDHIRVRLAAGLERAYSLVNAPKDRTSYKIAVQLAPESRGGSERLFKLHEGFRLGASQPVSGFPLKAASETVFIAGGIGISAIWSMVQHCEAEGRNWKLYYGARRPDVAAYLDDLKALETARPGRVTFRYSELGERLDLQAIAADAGPEADIYCCGPSRMISALRDLTANRSGTVHFERFDAVEATGGGYEVHLRQSGRTFYIPDGKSILDVLLEEGLEPDYSCMSGSCGMCRMGVISGKPDHQDFFLTDEERAANDAIMICCSGCAEGPLVLDF